jgi:hypothetical protein
MTLPQDPPSFIGEDEIQTDRTVQSVLQMAFCFQQPVRREHVRFQILTAASMKFRVFWDVLPCSQVDVDRRFRRVYCLHHQGSEWEARGRIAGYLAVQVRKWADGRWRAVHSRR